MHALFVHPDIKEIITAMRAQQCIEPLIEGWDLFVSQSCDDQDRFLEEFSRIMYIVFHILVYGCTACVGHYEGQGELVCIS